MVKIRNVPVSLILWNFGISQFASEYTNCTDLEMEIDAFYVNVFVICHVVFVFCFVMYYNHDFLVFSLKYSAYIHWYFRRIGSL